MEPSAIHVWASFGLFLMFLEFLLPGLVVVFVGLGALTVSLGLLLGYIDTLAAQFSTWFVSTLIYTFTLRIAVVRLLPADIEKQEMNEDRLLVGTHAVVTATIYPDAGGRVAQGDSTWKAVGNGRETIPDGTTVYVVARDNITLTVQTTAPETEAKGDC